MKKEILELLYRKSGEYVSGEDLSKYFHVSRTAVWKSIHALIDEGYPIISHPRTGYTICENDDSYLPGMLLLKLKTEWLGKTLHYYLEIGSTNKEAKRYAADAENNHGDVFYAEQQHEGRGRLGRPWYSPTGSGILMSMILRPDIQPQEAPLITFVAAVSVAEAIREITGLTAGIKWPNDILLDGHKIAGILTEMNSEIDRVNYIVIGIGINVNQQNSDFPEDMHDYASSLYLEGGVAVSRDIIFCRVLEKMEHNYNVWINQGSDVILSKWRDMALYIGSPIRLFDARNSFEGVFIDIDNQGALHVLLDDGITKVFAAGEISLRAK